ncbi:NifU family protein [Candidatus Parcubacteria bacterium]|nr:NifU family protein [Candidatus Parcubacteria bacterium]
MTNKIKEALDKVRPAMQADGGDVEFVNFDEKSGKLEVRLKGMCVGCPMAKVTLNEGIKKQVQKVVPEIKEVVSV